MHCKYKAAQGINNILHMLRDGVRESRYSATMINLANAYQSQSIEYSIFAFLW